MKPTSSDAAILAAVGNALADWSGVELQLCNLFQKISDIPDLKKARALFDGIISLEIRLGICDRLMAMEQVDEVEAEMWCRMSSRITKFYKKRHELAHFTLVGAEGAKQISPFLTMEKWTANRHGYLGIAQIEERRAKFVELFYAMFWFIARAIERRPLPGTSPVPGPPEPPLVLRLRDLATQIVAERKRPPRQPQA